MAANADLACSASGRKSFDCDSLQDFVEEQAQVARLVMQLKADSADEQFGVLLAACERFMEGGPGRLVKNVSNP